MSSLPDNPLPDELLAAAQPRSGPWRDYLELTKPRITLLIVFTAVVGMVLASPGAPPLAALLVGSLGIGMASASAAAFNHVLDRRFDGRMARTRRRPLPTGHLRQSHAIGFATALGVASFAVLALGVNLLTAVLSCLSLIGYAIVYTVWLKHATPQNIVIGGAAGASPPLLGWAAVTGHVPGEALVLFLIIFLWTPPHFWSLAIARRDDYARAGIPMLPVTHGVAHTRVQILWYTLALVVATLLPVAVSLSGLPYLVAAVALNLRFLQLAWILQRGDRPQLPMQLFRYSITYLGCLFAALIVDHYIRGIWAAF